MYLYQSTVQTCLLYSIMLQGCILLNFSRADKTSMQMCPYSVIDEMFALSSFIWYIENIFKEFHNVHNEITSRLPFKTGFVMALPSPHTF